MQILVVIHSGIRTQAHNPTGFLGYQVDNPLIRVPTCLFLCLGGQKTWLDVDLLLQY